MRYSGRLRLKLKKRLSLSLQRMSKTNRLWGSITKTVENLLNPDVVGRLENVEHKMAYGDYLVITEQEEQNVAG